MAHDRGRRPRHPSIPALRFHGLTRWYDPILRATLKEDGLKALLVAQTGPRPGQRVLDLGCGTATLTIMLKRAYPAIRVVGLDDDPAVLAIAREKVTASGVGIDPRVGSAVDPPFTPASFDRVVSSLLFHHLTTADKARALGAARRLLRPGGQIHIADWGRPRNRLMRVAFLGVQLLDGFRTTQDAVRGRLIPLLADAGFASVVETQRVATVFGTFSLYSATRPREARPGALSALSSFVAAPVRRLMTWPMWRPAVGREASR